MCGREGLPYAVGAMRRIGQWARRFRGAGDKPGFWAEGFISWQEVWF